VRNAVIAAIAAALAAGTAVWADGGDPDQVHACVDTVDTSRPNVIVVAPGESCPAGTTPVHWPASAAGAVPNFNAPDELAVDSGSVADSAIPKKGVVKKLYKPLGVLLGKEKTVTKEFGPAQADPFAPASSLTGTTACPASHPLRISGGYEVVEPPFGVPFAFSVWNNSPIGSHAWSTTIAALGGKFTGTGIQLAVFSLKVSATCVKVAPKGTGKPPGPTP
jgi:hypothetical protein